MRSIGDLVDVVIDGGYGGIIPSTILDCSGDEPELVREGLGEVDFLVVAVLFLMQFS